jgi:hypothetical protein
MRASRGRVVVFDLDETLGCFVELGMFWDAVKSVIPGADSRDHLFSIIKLFPEFIRPNMIETLSYLKRAKTDGRCSGVMIYTNNQGDRSWAEHIAAYFNTQVGYELFDQVIAAFRVRGKVVEVCRTSHDKSVADFLRCTSLPVGTRLCFLDDQYHPQMEDESVYYINVKPFTASIPFSDMAERYYAAVRPQLPKERFVSDIVSFMKGYSYTPTITDENEKRVDIVVSRQMLVHIKKFMQGSVAVKTKRQRRPRETRRSGTRRRRANI